MRPKVRNALVRAYRLGERVPRGLRSLAGVVLMALGLVGFLPLAGFWMLPLGILFVALDIPPARRWIERRLEIDAGD